MARLVPRPLSPPAPELTDFTVNIQQNLEEIFQIGHGHDVRTTAPAATEGSIGDVFSGFRRHDLQTLREVFNWLEIGPVVLGENYGF
jgi:hypothetical protein